MTRITTPFGFSSTADEVARGIDLFGRRAIITGATSGIGIETARTLAATGAQVTLAVRNTAADEATAADITATTGNKDIHVARLDVSDRTSVDAFVQAWQGPLYILVNNAGIMATPELERTREGWEMQFATNHLDHFALTTGLHGALAADGNARIVVVSSSGHLISPVVFDDINFRYRAYDPLMAYGQSKTATVLFAVEATRRWAADSITANALMPGAIATNLQRHTGGLKTPTERRKTPSRVPQPQCCWPPLLSWRGSAAATSKTAKKPSRSPTATAGPAESHDMHSTPPTQNASGTSPCDSCPDPRLHPPPCAAHLERASKYWHSWATRRGPYTGSLAASFRVAGCRAAVVRASDHLATT
jgi:NAD(P)-dependent dehydrogenase (short-subunit alcohol dehydrogenase family)